MNREANIIPAVAGARTAQLGEDGCALMGGEAAQLFTDCGEGDAMLDQRRQLNRGGTLLRRLFDEPALRSGVVNGEVTGHSGRPPREIGGIVEANPVHQSPGCHLLDDVLTCLAIDATSAQQRYQAPGYLWPHLRQGRTSRNLCNHARLPTCT
ncbi:MAG: hypothetical protein M3N28_00280 [Actinomycetota bacterium]|nr:hypothetical protein [Actinomycetota bacterium]